MAKKSSVSTLIRKDPPKNLNDHIFYGLTLDDEQKTFRDAIYSKDNDIVFCEAAAGTGKTLISVATAMIMCEYGLYDGITYIVAPTQEEKLGFLPGDVQMKVARYCDPLYDALYKLEYDPERVIESADDMEAIKTGEAVIRCTSHVYLRGRNFNRRVIIVEEAQNLYFDEMKRVLSRCCDDCKVIVIGNVAQCDIYKHPENSGFAPYLKRYAKEDRCVVCELNTNHRGWISTVADTYNWRYDLQHLL